MTRVNCGRGVFNRIVVALVVVDIVPRRMMLFSVGFVNLRVIYVMAALYRTVVNLVVIRSKFCGVHALRKREIKLALWPWRHVDIYRSSHIA